jgi:uridine phosphorylase
MEFLIAYGGRSFVGCGGCGVLDPAIAAGHVLVPTCAVRDEGTSYHYLPPSREVSLSPPSVATIRNVLVRREIPHIECKTWTTDAFFRETKTKVARRRGEGCLAVEMECAALAAVAQFRGVQFAQILYSGDSLGDETDGYAYDERDWWKNLPAREQVFHLALEAAASVPVPQSAR